MFLILIDLIKLKDVKIIDLIKLTDMSVSGVAVIIVAFQAADPGSTPG